MPCVLLPGFWSEFRKHPDAFQKNSLERSGWQLKTKLFGPIVHHALSASSSSFHHGCGKRLTLYDLLFPDLPLTLCLDSSDAEGFLQMFGFSGRAVIVANCVAKLALDGSFVAQHGGQSNLSILKFHRTNRCTNSLLRLLLHRTHVRCKGFGSCGCRFLMLPSQEPQCQICTQIEFQSCAIMVILRISRYPSTCQEEREQGRDRHKKRRNGEAGRADFY